MFPSPNLFLKWYKYKAFNFNFELIFLIFNKGSPVEFLLQKFFQLKLSVFITHDFFLNKLEKKKSFFRRQKKSVHNCN